jgi:neutral ceramidase
MRGMEFLGELRLGAASRTIELPFRRITDDELRGTTRGAQRFVDPTIYDRGMAPLVERIKQQGTQKAEVQALMMGEYVVVGVPAEYFVEHGLRIKQQSHPWRALVVSCANGMVGYVPTRQAFERGGYETTFAASSKLAPEAGDLLADCAIELIRGFRE